MSIEIFDKKLRVGDIITKAGEEKKFVITSMDPVKGLPQYITIMDSNGRAKDIWIRLVTEVKGHIDINYIFESLSETK